MSTGNGVNLSKILKVILGVFAMILVVNFFSRREEKKKIENQKTHINELFKSSKKNFKLKNFNQSILDLEEIIETYPDYSGMNEINTIMDKIKSDKGFIAYSDSIKVVEAKIAKENELKELKKKEEERKAKEIRDKELKEHHRNNFKSHTEKTQVINAVKSVVKQDLKNPSSAKFSSMEASVSNNIITVTGFVEGTNGFGATIRQKILVKTNRDMSKQITYQIY